MILYLVVYWSACCYLNIKLKINYVFPLWVPCAFVRVEMRCRPTHCLLHTAPLHCKSLLLLLLQWNDDSAVTDTQTWFSFNLKTFKIWSDYSQIWNCISLLGLWYHLVAQKSDIFIILSITTKHNNNFAICESAERRLRQTQRYENRENGSF